MRSKAIFMALLAFAIGGVEAVPVSREQARSVAQMWAARGRRLGVRMGTEVEDVAEYAPARGGRFFAVRMKGGTVFTAGDTQVNPVLAFTRERIQKLDPNSPLYKLLSAASQAGGGATAPRQWATLQAKADRIASSKVPVESEEEIGDVRVSPLLATKWGQSTVVDAGGAEVDCFNFYTPPTQTVIKEDITGGYAETNESVNCVCGCVATAMAQLMRYWCWPQGEVAAFENAGCSVPTDTSVLKGVFWGPGDFQCLVAEQNPIASTNLTTVAGAYDWANMVEIPDGQAVEDNCKAIGKLTYDCGVAVGMDYNLSELGGSGIYTSEGGDIGNALRDRFGYTSALLCTASGLTTRDSVRQKVIFANLDAKCPVLLLITGNGGHAVVGDGYGFDRETGENLPYVHLNMGWQGQCDVWYNLPYVNTAANPERFSGFDTIDGVVYNVFTNTTGWIISGRVLDTAGQPIPGARVTLRDGTDAVVGETTAESSGVYAFFVPGGENQYDVFAESSDGLKMADRLVDIKGGSTDGSNSWGNDLTLRDPTVRVTGTDGTQLFASLDSALRVATNAGDRVEILHTTSLRRDSFIGNDLTLTAVQATPSKINRQNGATISITNGVASLANIAFRLEATTPVLVGVDGKVSVAGRVELDDIASMLPGIELADADGFDLAGELANGLTIGCPAAAAGAVFGTYSCDPAVAEASAKLIVTDNPDLVGQAAEDGTLKWQSAEEVDPLVAVCYQDAEPARHYRTMDKLIANLGEGEAANIVVTRNGCRLSRTQTVAGAASIRGETEGLSVAVLGNDETPQFTIPTGASLVVSNLTFAGYTGFALFKVTGGSLTLEDGATIDGAVGTGPTHSGAVAVTGSGAATVRPGARIVNCRAEGASACGGAIWVSNGGCTLNLEGGEITGCWAKSNGGGVYVYSGSSVNVSGDVNIHDNTSGAPGTKIDDLYLMSDTSKLMLTGPVTGRVGVRRGGESGNAEGESFLTLGEGVSAEVAAASLPAFFNDTTDGLVAEISEDGKTFVWAVPPPYTGEVAPEDAWDWVIYNDGTPQAVTNYYDSFEMAYASLTNDATIVVLGEEWIVDDVTVTRKVLIRTNDPEGAAGLYRAGECKFTVDVGGSLTLEGIVMSGLYWVDPYSDPYGGTEALLYVKMGGSLTLGDGAFVCNVWGDGGRARGGVVVWGGEFRMLPGATIYACGNDYPYNETVAVAPANVGVGGGLLIDSGTAYLEGGCVTGCWAARAAGVYVGNKSTVYVTGDVAITNNFTLDEVPSNLTVEDKSELLVTNAFDAASIGVADGIQCNTNVFGRVPASALPDGFASATNYLMAAACFHRDDDASVIGQVVANEDEALLVWPWAVKDGVYVDEDGNSYELVSTQPIIAIPQGLALTYTGEEQTGVQEGTGYTLTGDHRATNAGDYTATATLTEGYRWSDGSFTDKAIRWSIAKATYDMSGVVFTNVTYVCDGAVKSNLVDAATLPEGVSVTNYLNNGQTEVGEYTVTAQFGGDADNYEPIADMTAKLTIVDDPTPPPTPPPGPTPQWEVETYHPDPIAFKSIERVSDTEWALVITNRVEFCNYRLIWTEDLTKGFTSTGKWEHAVGPAAEPVWTTNVITTGGAWFWRAEGANGTNMVPSQVEN